MGVLPALYHQNMRSIFFSNRVWQVNSKTLLSLQSTLIGFMARVAKLLLFESRPPQDSDDREPQDIMKSSVDIFPTSFNMVIIN